MLTIWSANISTVFSENFLPQYTNKSSKLGPSKSRTSTLSSPSTPDHLMPGIPPDQHYTNNINTRNPVPEILYPKFIQIRRKNKQYILPP